MLNIEIIPCLKDNYSYLLYDKDKNIVAIIDPSDFNECDKIINKKYNKLDFILLKSSCEIEISQHFSSKGFLYTSNLVSTLPIPRNSVVTFKFWIVFELLHPLRMGMEEKIIIVDLNKKLRLRLKIVENKLFI